MWYIPALLGCLVSFTALVIPLEAATSTQRTYGIYGAIQSTDQDAPTAARLQQQCYAGFALNSCQDLNATAGFHKDYSFASQFTDVNKQRQPFCLQCCTKPVPTTGADETWNLSCPLNDLQRLSVSQGRRTFRFARRLTLEDDEIVQCEMPARNLSMYLSGYHLELRVVERSADYGVSYWRSVLDCSVTITESELPPDTFNEVMHLRSVPTPQERPTAWILPAVLIALALAAALTVPLYKGKLRGLRCVHCGSWLMVTHDMCVICICVGCSLHPPPPKIYVMNGKPYTPEQRDTTVSS